jgi:hypothetical protein
MKILHAIVAIAFVFIGAALYTADDPRKRTPAFLALLIANVSLAAISIEGAIDRRAIEDPDEDERNRD